MSAIINIAIDSALTISWWVVRQAVYGVYAGTHYLIWGHMETDAEKREKLIAEDLRNIKETQKKLLAKFESDNDNSNSNKINDKSDLTDIQLADFDVI